MKNLLPLIWFFFVNKEADQLKSLLIQRKGSPLETLGLLAVFVNVTITNMRCVLREQRSGVVISRNIDNSRLVAV